MNFLLFHILLTLFLTLTLTMNTIEIPKYLLCPITSELMQDPVIAEDGYTYDRQNIMKSNYISPITLQFIDINNLITNRTIKNTIDELKKNNPLILSSSNQNLSKVPSNQNLSKVPSNQNLSKVPSNQNLSKVPSNQKIILSNQVIKDYKIRSPWDDNIYSIKFNNPIDLKDIRVSTTLIAVLDTSGSMGESCSNTIETDGFTRLNLVQHSMNTVINMLNPGDELIMIEFNNNSRYIFNQIITETNKILAVSSIDSLFPNGGTYIWNGLQLAYQSAKKAINNNIQIMLLTDGQSNDNPLAELKYFFQQEPRFANIKLTTFGFSYDINSKILFDIAELTNSGFNFIPDASMVGTCFCNYLANILSPDISIPIINKINLYEQQNFDISTLTNFNILEPIEQYELIRYHCYQVLKETCVIASENKYLNNNAISSIAKFKLFISGEIIKKSQLLENMIKDFSSNYSNEEQITKAISKQDWFDKWGYHYLLSLSLAHLTRQCHNYKDKGVQDYGNTIFQELQDEVYKIFSSIKPPKPSLRTQVVTTSMASYVDRSGGCFGPKCRIKLFDGSYKCLDELDGSEIVYQGDLSGIIGDKIKYITKTKIPNGQIPMCQIDNLIISEYHPFLNNISSREKWDFPINYIKSNIIELEWMYNIVLESGYWVEIEDFKCVSLGHNITQHSFENEIILHDYFGSNKVISDLEKFKTNSYDKIIILDNFVVLRDSNTNLVRGINKI